MGILGTVYRLWLCRAGLSRWFGGFGSRDERGRRSALCILAAYHGLREPRQRWHWGVLRAGLKEKTEALAKQGCLCPPLATRSAVDVDKIAVNTNTARTNIAGFCAKLTI